MRARNIKNYLLMLSMLIMLQMQELRALDFAYITDTTNSEVLVVDRRTNTQVTAIPVPGGPTGLAATSDGARVYVTCSTSSDIKYIDTETNTVVGSIPITGSVPSRIAITPDDTTAYVVGTLLGVSVVIPIDLTTNTLGTAVPTPGQFTFQDIAINSVGTMAYITAADLVGPAFSFVLFPMAIPSNILGASITLAGFQPSSFSFIALSPDDNYAYISSPFSDVFTADLNALTVTSVFAGAGGGRGIVVAPNGATAYIVIPSLGGVVPLDLANPALPVVASVVPTGTSSIGVDITPDGGALYVANNGSSNATPLRVLSPLAPSPETNVPLLTSLGTPTFPFLLIIVSTPPPAAPTNVTGVIRTNTFLNMTERFLIISWTASSNTYDEVVSYRIYRGNVLVGTVLASDPLCFKTCLRGCDCGQSYFVAAVDADGVESNRISVEIQ